VRQTLETTGQAMLVTSLVLCCGFFSYMLAELNNLFYFGMLTGLAIALAFIADVIVSPALVVLATRGKQADTLGPARAA
jgi:predicted RND superfamily exporter protein